MQTLKELIEQLPPELQQEVRDFVEFLLKRRAAKLKDLTISPAPTRKRISPR